MNVESSESDACCPPSMRCIGSHSRSCWRSTCYFIGRAWDISANFIAESWVYISRKLNCCSDEAESEIRESSSEGGKHDQQKPSSKESLRNESTTKPTSPGATQRIGSSSGPNPQQTMKVHSSVQQAPHTISSTQAAVMSQPPLPLSSPSSPPHADVRAAVARGITQLPAQTPTPAAAASQTQAVLQTAPNEPTIRSSLGGSPTHGKTIPDHEVVLPEPPKIDFVETGSIFGDRKRPTIDQSMLQLENGRFRSPGQSKVIQGPGGRVIRVSFVSGFPAVKSVESYRSLAASQGAKMSRKSVDSVSTDKNGLEAGGSRIRKMKSVKSVKSQTSEESFQSKTHSNNDKFNK